MIKHVLVLGIGGLSIGGTAFAQSAAVAVDDLRAPTAPAFVLLGVTPAAVDRPQTPKSFTVNLFEAVARANGLPKNYALEIAPYWLTSHPNLTFAQYQRPNMLGSIAQSLAFSVATAPITGAAGTSENGGSRIGLGVRTNLWSGTPNPGLEELVKELADVNGAILDKIAKGQSFEAERQQAGEVARAIQAMDGQRLGFLLTVAAGQVWSFPADNFEVRQRDGWGVWITPAYRFRGCAQTSDCEAVFDVVGVLRSLKDRDDDTQWDVGGRFIWQPNRELSVSMEVLRRRGSAEAARRSDRTVGLIEYRIKDDLLLFGSFGRDFKKEAGTRPLVSILGLNIGFGKKPLVRPM